MEKNLLSLKTLYKILMTNDFPIYSESVICERNRRGQTLLRFWNEQLVEEFRCHPFGILIWRTDGKRSRHVSNLCNRSPELKIYSEYAHELASELSVLSLMKQITRFSEFLSSREYRPEVLMRRLRKIIPMWDTDDPGVTRQITEHLLRTLDTDMRSGHGTAGVLFQSAYLLTVLTIYASAGEAMGDAGLSALTQEPFCLSALWGYSCQSRDGTGKSAHLMTGGTSVLLDAPLPRNRFFGREEALYDLRELAASGEKYLISGIGGIGKTELMRHLFQCCQEERLVDRIAVVSYGQSLAGSFARAFGQSRQQDPDDSLRRVLHRLEKESEQNRVLLIIDDLTRGTDEDPDLSLLCRLPCTVLITTRRTSLEGFRVYGLGAPSVSTGSLIFRDNYGRALSPSDRASLTELLEKAELCHPLTLKLMAQAARSKKWTLQELRSHLEKNEPLIWSEDGRTVRLAQIYRQLYSLAAIPPERQLIVELFTLLPYGTYTQAFLTETFPEIFRSDPALQQVLDRLTESGWLNACDSGFSMHPLVAQCLRRRVITQKTLEPMLPGLRSRVRGAGGGSTQAQEILLYMAELLTGPVDRELMIDILCSVRHLVLTVKEKEYYRTLLGRLSKRCREWDDELEMRCCIAAGHLLHFDRERVARLYYSQKEHPTLPRALFLDFCLESVKAIRLAHEQELDLELTKELLSDDAAPDQRVEAYAHLGAHYEIRGESEKALSWCRIGAEYAEAHPECAEHLRFEINATLCTLCLKFGQKALTEQIMKQLSGYVTEGSPPQQKIHYEGIRGNYQLIFGNPETALLHLRKCEKLIADYYGHDYNYLTTRGQITIVLQRLGRHSEALELYEALVAEAAALGNDQLLHLFSNNLAVLYLEMEQPEQALRHLETAMVMARQQGGIALGETLKNRARAHGQKKEYAAERDCLAEACPLLDAAYGQDHPRARAARQRLQELAHIS